MSIKLSELAGDWLGLTWDYRPNAFWFWNAEMDEERMREAVAEMARAGIRDVLIHPIHGMMVEYLSEEFFSAYRSALSLMREHGLGAWIYDEYGWPSGNAGGMLLRRYPEARGWYLSFERAADGSVTAAPRQSDRILDNVVGAPWTGSEGGYVDTLSPDAVARFVQLTHESFFRECSDYFGSVIRGFFTDEPVTMMSEFRGDYGAWGVIGLPWTPAFPARFRDRFGYDIEPLYAGLAGDGPTRHRRDYWTLVKELYIDAWHGQISRWCHEHGVLYTGHVGEDSPLQQVRFTGSVFGALSHMDIPGIDYLGCTPPPDERWADHALIPSIARHTGRDRVFCEAYGISPPDIRLSRMLAQAEMFGLYGINDIALMGFHQSVHGVRKLLYWSPLFMETPWWSMYAGYRDALARAIGLTSLGTRVARYAILYPQDHLEQSDPFDIDEPNWENRNTAARMVRVLGRAIYGAGEWFDFVFPEILHQAEVREGRIVFPNAAYQAILAPADALCAEEISEHLARLADAGGTVLREDTDLLATRIRAGEPSWLGMLSFAGGRPPSVRVCRWQYADGDLFAIRNSGAESTRVELTSRGHMTLWDAAEGCASASGHGVSAALPRHGTLYISLTDVPVTARTTPISAFRPIEATWRLVPEKPNTARLANVRFLHPQGGWLAAVDSSCFKQGTGRALSGLPQDFAGFTDVEFRAEFECMAVPHDLGIIFEKAHLAELKVNETEIDLRSAIRTPHWDSTCALVPVGRFARPGPNTVGGRLRYEAFETSTHNHVVYSFRPMPMCDVFAAGSFALRDGVIEPDDGRPRATPIDFGAEGYSEFAGVVTMVGEVELDEETARRVRGIRVAPCSEDGVEVLLDGHSIGVRIRSPYDFDIGSLAPGRHALCLRVSGTTANLFGNPAPWGVDSVGWLFSEV